MDNADVYEIPVYRLRLVQEGTAPSARTASPAALAAHLADLAASDREETVAVFLDTRLRPVGRQTVGTGTLDAAPADPAGVFKGALLANARALVLAHNHPSGDTAPSAADDALTRRLARAGALLGVRLLDHVILAPSGDYYSYQERRPALLDAEAA